MGHTHPPILWGVHLPACGSPILPSYGVCPHCAIPGMIFVLPSKIEAIQRNFKERPLSTSLIHSCPFCFHFLEAVLPAWCFHQALDLCSTYETCLCVVHTCVEYMCMRVYVHGHIEVRERRHWLSPIPILPPSPLPVPLRRVLSLNLEPVVFRLTLVIRRALVILVSLFPSSVGDTEG